MTDLCGKKCLVFSPYGTTVHYGEAIKAELVRRGAIVKGYDERPSQGTFSKILIRLLKKKVPQFFNNYIKGVIDENANVNYDYILICRGEAFNEESIALLRKAFPNAKIILYLWDILRCADLRHIIKLCDKAMSFDPQDVEENDGLDFRPTFYMNEFSEVKDVRDPKYDCIFIGTIHSNRHLTIASIEKSFANQGVKLSSYLFIPSRVVYMKDFVMKFPYISLRKINFEPLSLTGSIAMLADSKAILDINYIAQKSLSYRAFEAMAARRKYITTNPEVQTYDFYNPNNIAVIDLANPVLPEGFLDTPFIPVPSEVLSKYSVQGLVNDLFS